MADDDQRSQGRDELRLKEGKGERVEIAGLNSRSGMDHEAEAEREKGCNFGKCSK
jgi:hypothetical protein